MLLFMGHWALFLYANVCAGLVAALWSLRYKRAAADLGTFVASWLTLYLGVIVLLQTILGLAGQLRLLAMLVTLSLAAGISLLLCWKTVRTWRIPMQWRDSLNPANSALKGGLAVGGLFLCAWVFVSLIGAALATPSVLFDTLGYHMPTVVDWLQNRSLTPFYLPFSEIANSYFPGNGELFYLWLFAPFHNDLLVRLMNTGMWCILAFALYRVCRKVGASRNVALPTALLFLLTPAILGQATESSLDITCVAVFILAIDHLLEYDRSGDWPALALFSVASGIFLGIKYSGPLYLLLLAGALALLLAARPARSLGSIAGGITTFALGVLVFGGYWYVRNLVWTTNPMFPLKLSAFGRTILNGPAASYPNLLGDYLTRIPAGVYLSAGISGWGVFLAMVAVAIFLTVPMLAHKAMGQPALAGTAGDSYARPIMLVTLLMVASLLIYLRTPYSIMRYSATEAITPTTLTVGLRFGFIAAALLCVLSALVLSRYRSAASLLWFAVLISVTLGLMADYDAGSMPLFAINPFPVTLVRVTGLLVALIASAGYLLWKSEVWSRLQLRGRAWSAFAAGFAGLVLIGLVLGLCQTQREKTRLDFYAKAFPQLASGWRWLDNNIADAKIAVSGSLSYPLYGSFAQNAVRYVNVAAGVDDRYHDFFGKGTGYRQSASYDTWLRNLQAWGAQYWVLNGIKPPIELTWAQQHPNVFEPVFVDGALQIFRIKYPGQ
jgi:hypothetical protein